WGPRGQRLGALGLDGRRPWSDLGRATVLLAVVGGGGLLVYAGGRLLAITVAVQPNGIAEHWWTVPVLLLAAARAGLQEEFVLGYLFDRLRRIGWHDWTIIVAAAAFRATYHLYQGLGAWVGNFAMGLIFGWAYRRWGRLLPLILAHALIDAIV